MRAQLLALLLGGSLLGQQAASPDIDALCHIDGGIRGVLVFADGSRQGFHLEASGARARLLDDREPSAAKGELAPGSDGEARILRGLDDWIAATFTKDEQQRLLALPKLESPRTQAQDFAHRQATLLRTVHRYELVTRATITKVHAGRGTVAATLQLRLGDGTAQQLLWQTIDGEPFARLREASEPGPVAIDSDRERTLLLGIGSWLIARLGGRDALWADEPKDLPDDVREVLRAYRGYLAATSPRLRGSGVVMNGNPAGSIMFRFTDAQDHELRVDFDHSAGTATPGRMLDAGQQLVGLGSARERELLATLQRASDLRHGWLGAEAAADPSLRSLDEQLAAYRAAFVPAK